MADLIKVTKAGGPTPGTIDWHSPVPDLLVYKRLGAYVIAEQDSEAKTVTYAWIPEPE